MKTICKIPPPQYFVIKNKIKLKANKLNFNLLAFLKNENNE